MHKEIAAMMNRADQNWPEDDVIEILERVLRDVRPVNSAVQYTQDVKVTGSVFEPLYLEVK